MKYLYKLLRLFFCPHKWAEIYKSNVFYKESNTMPMGQRYTLQCKFCGKLKFFKNYE